MAGASGQLPDGGHIVPTLPGYRIERQLGRGSMGVVYLAEDVHLRRKVALKVLIPTLVDDELFRKRFDRESQSAANLDHPHIVPIYAAGEAGGSLYIAMRYVGGGDLRAMIEANGSLSLQQAVSVITSVADALDTAHAQGMVHRDVKPANILIDDRNGKENYYLSDFGITKLVSSGRSLTSAGQIVGTIDYIAPEQIQGKPVDGRADLYALGCVLYQCLTGSVPFPREETAAFMWAHVHEEAPLVTAQRPDLPPQIDRIVAKAMAKQPEDRYATCGELALALDAAASGPVASGPAASAGSGMVPTGLIDSPPPPVSAGMTSTYAAPKPAPRRVPVTAAPSQRRWWVLVLGGVLALALVGGSTALVLNYFSSRFPNQAERTLLAQLPLALTLENNCKRNADAGRDTANVRASVTCTSGGDVNRVVFTTFTSPTALSDRYNAAVVDSESGLSSGDCRTAQRAEGPYASESGRISGRVLCYQERGSSFIEWTEDGPRTLGVATLIDPDYAKLRGWWAGVVDRTLPAPESTPEPAPPPAPVPPPAPPAPPAAPARPPAPQAPPAPVPAPAPPVTITITPSPSSTPTSSSTPTPSTTPSPSTTPTPSTTPSPSTSTSTTSSSTTTSLSTLSVTPNGPVPAAPGPG